MSIDFFSAEHGLPHKHVYDITQDNQGFMWIATRNGLVRFDGYRFEDFTYTISGEGRLKGQIIYAVEKDRHGQIWIGYDQGLAKLDPVTCKAELITLTGYNGADKSVQRILFDRSGRVLLYVPNATLLCYNEAVRLQFAYTFSSYDEKINLEFLAILQDADDSFWVSSQYYGVDHITPDGLFIEHFQVPENPQHGVVTKTLTTAGNLEYSLALGKRNTTRAAIPTYPISKMDMHMFRSYTRPTAIHDRMGNTYFIGPDEISLEGPFIDRAVSFTLPYMEEFLQDHALLNVYVGDDNTLWTASRKGIFKISYKQNPFKNYLSREGLGPTEYGISIRGMAEDESGRIWVGSYAYDVDGHTQPCNLARIDPRTHLTEPMFFKQEDSFSVMVNRSPVYKLIREGHTFWASTGSYYLYSFDPDTLSIKMWKVPDELSGTLTGIIAINDSSLFFTTVNASGIFRRAADGQVQFKGLLKNDSGQILDGINNFFKAGHNLFWAASNNGLYLLHAEGRVLRSYTQDDLSPVKLPALDINWAFPESPDKIWLGSRHGLILLDTLSGRTRLFTTNDGLPNNNVMGILPDEFGHLWLSTDHGLSRFDPEQNSFLNYDTRDGLAHNEFNRMASLKASDGRLYFGGLNGVTAFYPREVENQLNTFQPLLTNYSYYRGDIDSVMTIGVMPAPAHSFVFNHHDRLFHFWFMLPSYRQPDKNRFLYLLEGWDKEWQTTIGTNMISYNYLQPGEYTLRVRGGAAGSSWSQAEYRLSIVVRQAWYKTWWSLSLAVLAIGSFFYALYRYRLNALLRVQRVRNKISADLHDELGSVLTQISLQSDMVSRDIYNEAEKQKELENIRDTSRQAILTMSDIVWSVSAGHDKTSSLIDRMKDHADLMLQPFNIQPTFSTSGIPEDKIVDNQLRQELFLIFKEAIHNIVKHSRPTYVAIALHNQDSLFEMRIQNDINQVAQINALGGNGLKNMQRRAEAIGATLSFRTGDNFFEVFLQRKAI